MDKTWVLYFTSESNQQSAEWTATDESRPKRPKDANIRWQRFGLRILGCTRYFVDQLP